MPGPTIKYQDGATMDLTIRGVSAFLANPHSVIESKKIEIGGVQWYAVARAFVENGTTYLAYYMRGTKDGNWRQWINVRLHVVNWDTYWGDDNVKSLSGELRLSSDEDAYAEWGFDKFISKETLLGTKGYVRNDVLQLRLSFSYGIDIFTEKSGAHHTNMKLVVEGQPVFVNKDLLSIHSTVFERLFTERAGETEIALQEQDLPGLLDFLRVIYPPHEKLNARTVKAVYQMARFYGVDYLLEQCDAHVLGLTEFSLADKLALADDMKNEKLFDRLVQSLDKPSLKVLAVNADVNVQLRGKVVERYFRPQPRSWFRRVLDQPPELKKVFFAQETRDEGLLAYVIGNLTKREMAHLTHDEHKDDFTKETLMALFGKAHSLIP